jgi:hypothetical protein
MTKQEIKDSNKYQRATLLFLKENENFKNEFKKFAPEIEPDIESASINHNCSCESNVIEFIEKKKDEYIDFLYDFIVKNNVFITFLEILNSIVVYKDYSGKIAKTTISEWKDFSDSLFTDHATFRSFSVVKEGDDVFVFFL